LRSPFALVLSGTPLENRLDDLFSVTEFIDDRRLGPAFRFFNRHRVTDEKGKVLGYKNLERLRESLKPILLRRTRGAVMKDLPASSWTSTAHRCRSSAPSCASRTSRKWICCVCAKRCFWHA